MSEPKYIVCVGMCVLDIMHVCEEFPQEDTDKRCLDGYWQRGGNASNNCTVLRQLGANCEFLGMLSASIGFRFLLHDCHKRGIYIDGCPQVEQDPPFSSVILVQNSDSRTIIHSNSNFPIYTYRHFHRSIFRNIQRYSWIHFEARNAWETIQMMQDIQQHNAGLANGKQRIKMSVELEKINEENIMLANHVDFVFLGKDLAKYFGWTNAKEAVYGLKEQLKLQHIGIVCAWGAQGSDSLDAQGNYAHCEPETPSVIVDSLGAGDTFCAATIFALDSKGCNLAEAVRFGNRIAGFKLGHRGYDDIAEFVKN